MKNLLLAIFCFAALCVSAQKPNPKYNKRLADSLGGADYGMRKYVFVMLKTGPNKKDNKTYIDSCFKGHMDNINAMAKAGKLIIAGPFNKNDHQYRGIFVLNVATIEEAKELLKGDTAVKEQLLEPEYIFWYGSAALPMYLKFHEMIEKNSF
jgi:uncharacterized protein YciI